MVEKRIQTLLENIIYTMFNAEIQVSLIEDPLRQRVAAQIVFSKTHTQHFEVRWAGSGWPRDVRMAIADIPSPWPHKYIIAAHKFSKGALMLLRSLDANFIDEAGRAYIAGPNLLFSVATEAQDYHKTDRFSPIKSAPRWSPSALDLAALMLAKPRKRLKLWELSEATNWSAAQVSKVLRHFDENGWTEQTGTQRGPKSSRQIKDYFGLLDSWTEYLATHQPRKRYGHKLIDNYISYTKDSLAPKLNNPTEAWAITGWVATELVAPMLTTVPTLQVYVGEHDFERNLAQLMSNEAIREVDEGSNIEFWSAPARVLAHAEVKSSLPVVSNPQLFADLVALGGRAEDAATHIRETLLLNMYE